LSGTIDESAYKSKSNELKSEAARNDESMTQLGDAGPVRADAALALFDWAQRADELWRRSNNALRRQILDAVCLNRSLSDVNLVTTKRKPFDVLAEGLDLKNSRGNRTALELFMAGVRAWGDCLRQSVTDVSRRLD
jgi:hypothetical protein